MDPEFPRQRCRGSIEARGSILSRPRDQNERLPIHNNASERELRREAVGRKNWLFVGSDQAAEVNAAFVYRTVSGDGGLGDGGADGAKSRWGGRRHDGDVPEGVEVKR